MGTKPRAWVRENHRSKSERRHPSKKVWEVVYPNPDDPKRRKTKGGFRSKAQAEDWAQKFIADNLHGVWTDPGKATPTFAEVAQQWVDERTFERALTEHGYRKLIGGNNELTRTFNTVPVGDITPAMVRQYVSRAAATLSGQSVRKQFYILRWVLDQAVQDQFIRVNPARAIHRLNLPKQTTDDRAASKKIASRLLTPEQIDALTTALPEPYDMFIRLIAYTGMRPEEACALTLADVTDLDDDLATIHVRAVVVSVDGALIREDVTKTPESNRIIPLDPDTSTQLLAYIAAHRKRAAKWFSDHPEHEHPGEDLPLFVGTVVGGRTSDPVIDRLDYSKPMHYGAFYKHHWPRARKAAGLPDGVRVYDLRHTHLSTLLNDGWSLKDVQVRAGHKDPTMLLKNYWHARKQDDDLLRAQAAAVSASFRRTRKPDNVTPINKRTG